MKSRRILWLIWGLLLMVNPVFAAKGDVQGGVDYPLIGRFGESRIDYYRSVDFDQYRVITGPVMKKGVVDKGEVVKGRVIRIAYHAQPGTSILEVTHNFEQKLKETGFDILYACQASECGENAFRYTTEVLPAPHMSVDSWNYQYLAAKMHRTEGNVFASVLTSIGGDGKTKIQVFVVEEQAMKSSMVDAKRMAREIADTGSIALYGIYFDTNKASIKPESKGTLNQVAELLVKNPELKLIVVGHTDNQGGFDYNMRLSRRRADAVARELIDEYRIAAVRLKAWGVGYLSPVANNHSEEGRAKNRRVQLVEQ